VRELIPHAQKDLNARQLPDLPVDMAMNEIYNISHHANRRRVILAVLVTISQKYRITI